MDHGNEKKKKNRTRSIINRKERKKKKKTIKLRVGSGQKKINKPY